MRTLELSKSWMQCPFFARNIDPSSRSAGAFRRQNEWPLVGCEEKTTGALCPAAATVSSRCFLPAVLI